MPRDGPMTAIAGETILPLELRAVSFAIRGRPLIDGIDAIIEAGPRSVILGPNGAGKSLLLKLCHGLIRPTGGTIRWRGVGARPETLRRAQAMVFQRPVLLRRSVLANVTHALAVQGWPRRARRDRALAALEEAGLAALAGQPARVLSGGEQQRLALARAAALAPQVLFLDEPCANLDPAATRAVERQVLAIAAAGTKVVMTTHDLGQARRIADEVLFLHQGRLVERAPAETFFDAPHSCEAAAFLRGELLV
ncbi:MAG TPA: ATP-binding cassette domain-containing protein [Kiloniellales bacterium]|nr:ATP-binding cassette domain-containing protein [Kiloniellales bacterium]